MATSCLVNDYVKRKRTSLLFTEDNFTSVIDSWESDAETLVQLQSIEVFKGRTKWCDLDPVHFRLLITNVFNKRDVVVPQEEHFDATDQTMSTLCFLLMGLVYCMQQRTTTAVDTIRVNRVTDIDVTFEFAMTMMAEEKKTKPPNGGFKVIVDNTK